MKTNKSLLVIVPLLKEYGSSIEVLDTLDSIAEKATQVNQVVIYSDSDDYLQEILKECQESMSFPGFPENVTTCILSEGSTVSGMIEIALDDFSECTWILVLKPGEYLDEVPEILPDSYDFAVLSYNKDISDEISYQCLPYLDYSRYGLIISAAFLRGTEIYLKYEDSQFLTYLFLETIKNRANIFISSRNSLCGQRDEEGYGNRKYDMFKDVKAIYKEIWNELKDDSISEEVLETIQQWLWNTLNKLYVLYIFEKYPELTTDQEAIDFLLRGELGMKNQFNK